MYRLNFVYQTIDNIKYDNRQPNPLENMIIQLNANVQQQEVERKKERMYGGLSEEKRKEEMAKKDPLSTVFHLLTLGIFSNYNSSDD